MEGLQRGNTRWYFCQRARQGHHQSDQTPGVISVKEQDRVIISQTKRQVLFLSKSKTGSSSVRPNARCYFCQRARQGRHQSDQTPGDISVKEQDRVVISQTKRQVIFLSKSKTGSSSVRPNARWYFCQRARQGHHQSDQTPGVISVKEQDRVIISQTKCKVIFLSKSKTGSSSVRPKAWWYFCQRARQGHHQSDQKLGDISVKEQDRVIISQTKNSVLFLSKSKTGSSSVRPNAR